MSTANAFKLLHIEDDDEEVTPVVAKPKPTPGSCTCFIVRLQTILMQ